MMYSGSRRSEVLDQLRAKASLKQVPSVNFTPSGIVDLKILQKEKLPKNIVFCAHASHSRYYLYQGSNPGIVYSNNAAQLGL